jgi:hypothetical protein
MINRGKTAPQSIQYTTRPRYHPMVFPNAPDSHWKMGYIIPIRIGGEIMAMIFL